MLTQLSITGFRCFRQLDVELKPLTVLIGPNDTGKSVFLSAIELIGQPTRVVDVCDFYRNGSVRQLKFTGKTISDAAFSAELDWPEKVPQHRMNDHLTWSGFGTTAHWCQRFQLPVEGVATECPGFAQDELKSLHLTPSGSRLAALLDHLLRRNIQDFQSLVTEFQRHVPGLEWIKIETPQPESRRIDLVIEQGLELPASRVSAGVRLLLFFLALVHHPNLPKIILLEEPETGIHPKRLSDVMELLRGITRGQFGKAPAQVILTTHSPYLLDYVKPDEDQVLVFQRADDGSRTAKPVDWGRLKEFFDGFMLGEIWFNEEEAGLVGAGGIMKVLIVADGPRDEACLPSLLNVILNRTVECEFESWARIHHRGSGRGYDRKLRFSVGQARIRGHEGLVAVVDRDKDRDGHRAEALRSTRELNRQQGMSFPTAFGVADPHVDAWLLDDPVAVREGLGLASNADVISVHRTKNPKGELDRLIHESDLGLIDALRAIAERLQPRRCNHAKVTGFEPFTEDCRQELSTNAS